MQICSDPQNSGPEQSVPIILRLIVHVCVKQSNSIVYSLICSPCQWNFVLYIFIKMECIAEVIRRKATNSRNFRPSELQDEDVVYLQPSPRRPITYTRPYTKPTSKIESDTTYGLSYMGFDSKTRRRVNYGTYEQLAAPNTGKFDFDTVYKLSFPGAIGKIRRSFKPRSFLSITGSRDMTTIHATSYMNPGLVKTAPYTPYRGKVLHSVPMDHETVTKESYQNHAHIEVTRPRKREFWRTKSKTDYHTTAQLSYQHIGPVSKRTRVKPKRPIISAQIEKDTIFSTSYKVPGCFVNKKIVTFG